MFDSCGPGVQICVRCHLKFDATIESKVAHKIPLLQEKQQQETLATASARHYKQSSSSPKLNFSPRARASSRAKSKQHKVQKRRTDTNVFAQGIRAFDNKLYPWLQKSTKDSASLQNSCLICKGENSEPVALVNIRENIFNGERTYELACNHWQFHSKCILEFTKQAHGLRKYPRECPICAKRFTTTIPLARMLHNDPGICDQFDPKISLDLANNLISKFEMELLAQDFCLGEEGEEQGQIFQQQQQQQQEREYDGDDSYSDWQSERTFSNFSKQQKSKFKRQNH